ncbi:hypothetical protein [Bradyrhizobium japonicum]|nr:hypothetical protein [Bradyrhizobium japonicum]
MSQLQMFDPRVTPTATREMLSDVGLCEAIASMRYDADFSHVDVDESDWPYVERVSEIEGNPVWAVDDHGLRYVVIRGLVWGVADLALAEAGIRVAALTAFTRLDEVA